MTEEKSKQAEAREREHARRDNRATQPPLVSGFIAQVVGVSHYGDYPDALNDLRDEHELRTGDMPSYPMFNGEMAQLTAEADYDRVLEVHGTQINLQLVREPDNEYDPNAISVHFDGIKLGHLNGVLARRMAPEIDAGTDWIATVHEIAGPEDQPGLAVRCERLG